MKSGVWFVNNQRGRNFLLWHRMRPESLLKIIGKIWVLVILLEKQCTNIWGEWAYPTNAPQIVSKDYMLHKNGSLITLYADIWYHKALLWTCNQNISSTSFTLTSLLWNKGWNTLWLRSMLFNTSLAVDGPNIIIDVRNFREVFIRMDLKYSISI